jgi:hypothetical protein
MIVNYSIILYFQALFLLPQSAFPHILYLPQLRLLSWLFIHLFNSRLHLSFRSILDVLHCQLELEEPQLFTSPPLFLEPALAGRELIHRHQGRSLYFAEVF